jgi:hypothetical protein
MGPLDSRGRGPFDAVHAQQPLELTPVDQEFSVLCLHFLQVCRAYINTLMIQRVSTEPHRLDIPEHEDYRALTPLVYNHITPYGPFELDMEQRLPIE